MSTTTSYPKLIDSLDDLRKQWRSKAVAAGIVLTLAVVVGLLIGAVAVDNLSQPETAGRVALALLIWGTLAYCLVRFVVTRLLEDRRDDYFAVLVERKYPQLNNQFINALQLGRGSQLGHSPGLIEQIVSDAAAATADLELEESIDRRPLKQAFALAGGVLLVFALYAGFARAHFNNGLARVLLPFADIPPYAATQFLDVKPGEARFPEGSAVPVLVKLGGIIPARATLKRLDAKGEWLLTDLTRLEGSGDTFQCALPPVYDSFEYYLVAGDGRSKKYRLTVEKRPQVMALVVTHTPPTYTSLPPVRDDSSDGKLAGIAGTTVQIELKASKPLQSARFLFENGQEIVLDRGADAFTWNGSFMLWMKDLKPNRELLGTTVAGPSRYQIKLLDGQGYENADPLWREVMVTTDKPPTVALFKPGRDRSAELKDTIPLTISAEDDFGLGTVNLFYSVKGEDKPSPLHDFVLDPATRLQSATLNFDWKLSILKRADSKPLASNPEVEYWAVATDRNDLTGPGRGESRHFTLSLVTPEVVSARLEHKLEKYAEIIEELLRLQRKNRAETQSNKPIVGLVTQQADIRNRAQGLARVMEKDVLPLATVVKTLDDLHAGLLAESVRLLEQARDSSDPARGDTLRSESLPVQDKIIAVLQDILARLQRNIEVKEALKRIQKEDQVAAGKISAPLNKVINDTDKLLKDSSELMSKLEKLPKKNSDEYNKEEAMKATKELEEFAKKWEKWQKETVNELTKLPQGFTDDFKARKDINKIFEEIEKQAEKAKAQKMDVALEDMGVGLGTKMKEDLETWLPDAADATKWVMEEPLGKKPIQVPEMPLPKALEDLVGDLLQKAEEFDEEADDTTSAWGDNLDQAGWGTGDGPIASFSAKGKTGNDMPNNMEMTGRAGDGRRGKSSGQMVGDTARALPGRKTPARLSNEKFEPGQLKQEGSSDPNGATGGGKKAGAGKKGLQGGTPPDFSKESQRLADKQAGIKEKADQIAKKLSADGVNGQQLRTFVDVWKQSEHDLRDLKYDDAAKKRRTALKLLKGTYVEIDQGAKEPIKKAKELPPNLRNELIQASDEGYPAGYESLVKSYLKALSTAEK